MKLFIIKLDPALSVGQRWLLDGLHIAHDESALHQVGGHIAGVRGQQYMRHIYLIYLTQFNTVTSHRADFTWGYFQYYMDLEKSSVAAYQKLYQLAVQEHDASERSRNIRQNPRYGVYTEVIFGRFLTAIKPVMADALQMRLMRSCIDNHWTTFGLQKHSPYTEYFNAKIGV